MTDHANEPAATEAETGSEHLQRARAPGLADAGLLFARSGLLACEGAFSLLISTSPRDVWLRLVQAGVEWEEEYLPGSRGRTGSTGR
jgi:hypothetical protein